MAVVKESEASVSQMQLLEVQNGDVLAQTNHQKAVKGLQVGVAKLTFLQLAEKNLCVRMLSKKLPWLNEQRLIY